MGASQRGAIVGGAWLVGLGAVFLVQQSLDLSWGEAWPLFIILAGVGTGIGAVAGLAGRRVSAWMVAWALLWPALITVVGVLLFVDLAGLADVDAFGFLARWWPLALILVGVFVLVGALLPRSRGVEERVSIPVAGASRGEVNLKFGAGRLDVVRGTQGMLVDGTFEGGVRRRDLGPGRVELEADATIVWSWPSDGLHWTVGLAPDLPISLRLEGGASRSVLDLADLDVRSLTVKTGASDTRIRLPRDVAYCEVRVDAGAAQVSIEVPPEVAARIRSQMGLGSTNVDETRFPRTADGWASPEYAAASRQVDIRASGGVGTVKVA